MRDGKSVSRKEIVLKCPMRRWMTMLNEWRTGKWRWYDDFRLENRQRQGFRLGNQESRGFRLENQESRFDRKDEFEIEKKRKVKRMGF